MPGKSQQPRAADDDVEGHGGGGHKTPRAADDDVEGHRKRRAIDDEADVEGHRKRRAVDDGEDDAEGHMYGNPVLSQHLARAREQDIQRNLRNHEAREASRPHKK